MRCQSLRTFPFRAALWLLVLVLGFGDAGDGCLNDILTSVYVLPTLISSEKEG